MKSALTIISEVWQDSDLQLALTLNPSLDLVKQAMEEYAEQFKPKWISVDEFKPAFGMRVLVFCRIYGSYIASFEHIGHGHGNWHDGKQLGVLPPTHWMLLANDPPPNPIN